MTNNGCKPCCRSRRSVSSPRTISASRPKYAAASSDSKNPTRTRASPLSSLLRRLLTGHAGTFNRSYGRSGHLFQNRFKSILVEEEPYLLELVRYIHLNPVRARAVAIKDLDRYRWTGHSILLGHRSYPARDTDFILAQFGSKRQSARLA